MNILHLWICFFPFFPVPKGSGWWLSHPSEKYEFVSWDDDIPNIWKVIKIHGSIIDYYIPLYPIEKPWFQTTKTTQGDTPLVSLLPSHHIFHQGEQQSARWPLADLGQPGVGLSREVAVGCGPVELDKKRQR
jgi:hypothetical protein